MPTRGSQVAGSTVSFVWRLELSLLWIVVRNVKDANRKEASAVWREFGWLDRHITRTKISGALRKISEQPGVQYEHRKKATKQPVRPRSVLSTRQTGNESSFAAVAAFRRLHLLSRLQPYLTMSTTSKKGKSAEALFAVLQNHTASEIESSGKVIEIDSTMSPMEASQILWQNNILGAPVWDNEHQKYLGFFDMRDTLSAVIASHQDVKGEKSMNLMTKWFEDMNVTVTYLAARNPFYYCRPDTSLEDVCKLLVKHKCHRIPVVSQDTGRCQSIISQSALVKSLVEHVHDPLDETLTQAGLEYKKDIVQAPDTATALYVFQLLDSHRLSGIAVVDDETGKLVGNTSARDIKLSVLGSQDATMDQDILSYLARVRQSTFTKKERYPSAHVSEDSTVGHAIRLLAKTGYHRVFVVDKDTKPVGVISVADIIRFVVE